jgi:hypothetical protein
VCKTHTVSSKNGVTRDTTERVVALRIREIAVLQKSMDNMSRILEAIAPIHRQHETYRLFAPRYRTWKKVELTPLDYELTSSETISDGLPKKH